MGKKSSIGGPYILGDTGKEKKKLGDSADLNTDVRTNWFRKINMKDRHSEPEPTTEKGNLKKG